MSTPRWVTSSELRRRGALLAALGALVLGAGCPFDPRTPNTPLNPDCNIETEPNCQAKFKTPLTPEDVRDNVAAALRKVLGSSFRNGPTITPNYAGSLDSLFAYEPDPGASALPSPCGGRPFFEGWGLAREVQFMRTALEGVGSSQPDDVEMKFPQFHDSGELTGLDEKRYNVQYVLTLKYPATPAEPDGRTECYGAQAQWDLVGGSRNSWTLKIWRDQAPLNASQCPGGNTLGVLRATRGECGS